MRVLVACEFSGVVRDAFRKRGHDAWSCDIEASEAPGPHYQCDVMEILDNKWDLMIAHPPCTYLANSSSKHLYKDGRKENGRDPARWRGLRNGALFFRELLTTPKVKKKAVENPVMLGYAMDIIGFGPSQIIHPWWFGHPELKATGLWLDELPLLQPTRVCDPTKLQARIHRMAPGPNRQKDRSRTYQGIADAMAEQWGGA